MTAATSSTATPTASARCSSCASPSRRRCRRRAGHRRQARHRAARARERRAPGDACTVLDVSLDVNRAGAAGAARRPASPVRYFDHHFAGEVPAHPRLEAHLDLEPQRLHQPARRPLPRRAGSAAGRWSGRSATAWSRRRARWRAAAGLAPAAAERLQELGVAINYNAYGETIADLHVAARRAGRGDGALRRSAGLRRALADLPAPRRGVPRGHGAGAPARARAPGRGRGRVRAARRGLGAARQRHAGQRPRQGPRRAAPSPSSRRRPEGGYLVSVRVPRESSVSAEAFCRTFPTGGGRRTAAGINHLPGEELETFATAFEAQFRAG